MFSTKTIIYCEFERVIFQNHLRVFDLEKIEYKKAINLLDYAIYRLCILLFIINSYLIEY